MNSWANIAAKQLLEHWKRSGLSMVPSATPSGTERAKKWLESQWIELGVQEAESLGMRSTHSTEVHGRLEIPQPLANSATIPARDKDAVEKSGIALASLTPPAVRSPTANPHLAIKSPSIEPRPPISQETQWLLPVLTASERLEKLEEIRKQVVACRKCTEICPRRQQTVFGVGPANAKIVMFGEAPGADEDRVGEPFVGAAGQLLNSIIAATGLKREEVFIMNALKCRPPNNRTPTDSEIENCRPYFESQLEAIQPDYIVCWGAVAVRAVLRSTDSVGRLRGTFHRYRGAKVLVTYHPAYLLRNPDAKRLTWEDMKMFNKELGIPLPPPPKRK